MASIYQANLAGLLLLCGALFATRAPQEAKAKADEKAQKAQRQYQRDYQGSQWDFYVVYTLVMGADWLQGPFLYSLYREQYGIPAATVSALFTTGFVAGAVSATVTGTLADRHGRRLACLVFCAAYALSCLLTVLGGASVPLLFAGRVLGGVATSLLFSVFESWMVADFHVRRLGTKGFDLGRTFGTMGTLNSVVAILSGVASEWLVARWGSMKAPFVASVGLLGLAALFIWGQWVENYGESGSSAKTAKTGGSKLWATLASKQVLSLGLASTMFEGSMYLFVFFWTPALKAAKTTPGDLPYGLIFASFMAAAMAASLAFTRAAGALSYAQLLAGVLMTANLALFALASPRPEQATFWLFCVFEACVGMYWPAMGYLKGRLVDDGVRAQVYGLLRIPLNVFVVASLLLTRDGGNYGQVFSVCATLLLASAGAVYVSLSGEEAQ